MGACDQGRCCVAGACTDDRKCCCLAKNGRHVAGEVCRSASCVTGSSCQDNVPVCDCESQGGTLSQPCDPCTYKACDKCQTCVNGQCVSTCSLCQICDTSTINGTCVPKPCAVCETCVSGNCVSTGTPCGFPIVTCCGANQCCVNGTCKPCDCTGLQKPTLCHVCFNGEYVDTCGANQYCCAGVCKGCCNDSQCPSGKICDNGTCRDKRCSDYPAGYAEWYCAELYGTARWQIWQRFNPSIGLYGCPPPCVPQAPNRNGAYCNEIIDPIPCGDPVFP